MGQILYFFEFLYIILSLFTIFDKIKRALMVFFLLYEESGRKKPYQITFQG